MATSTTGLSGREHFERGFDRPSAELAKYAYDLFRPEDEALAHARETAEIRGLPPISMGAFDARHLEIITRLMGARKAVEIGTQGGYSGIAIARGLGAGGRLHTFELDPHHAEVAKGCFERAHLLASVIVHSGPALENLPRISNEAPFDLVFIDADPENYMKYLSWATDHLRVGGAVIAENTFGGGNVHKLYGHLPAEEKAIASLREFNQVVATSGRFRSTIFPTGEGLTVAIKLA